MTNTEIAEALSVLLPNGNWGAFYGDANNEDEFNKGLYFTGKETAPTWAQVKTVVIQPPKETTTNEKLALVGLSVDDLKAALGL